MSFCPSSLLSLFSHSSLHRVEAGDLLAYVEKKGRLNEDEGKFLFHQLCVGVKYLHDAGVIHRDLKVILLCVVSFFFMFA